MKKQSIVFLIGWSLLISTTACAYQNPLPNLYNSLVTKIHEYKECLEQQSCTPTQKLVLFGLATLFISTIVGATVVIKKYMSVGPQLPSSDAQLLIAALANAVVKNETSEFTRILQNLKKLPLNLKNIAQQKTYNKEGYELPLLVIAAQYGNTHIVTTLIAMGADLNEGLPLHNALFNNQQAAALIIIDKGADVNIVAGEGQTPLMLAVARCQVNVIPSLLAHGANKEATNYEGKTALQQLQFFTDRCIPNREALIKLLQ